LIHGIWSNAAAAWTPFQQWLSTNYPTNLVSAADYGNPRNNYSALAFSDPSIQKILETTVANALTSAAAQGVVAREVDVVAHSMGGLVTRYFIANANKPPYPLSYLPANPVHQLITIGTRTLAVSSQQRFGITRIWLHCRPMTHLRWARCAMASPLARLETFLRRSASL